jgi:hypothetical protein
MRSPTDGIACSSRPGRTYPGLDRAVTEGERLAGRRWHNGTRVAGRETSHDLIPGSSSPRREESARGGGHGSCQGFCIGPRCSGRGFTGRIAMNPTQVSSPPHCGQVNPGTDTARLRVLRCGSDPTGSSRGVVHDSDDARTGGDRRTVLPQDLAERGLGGSRVHVGGRGAEDGVTHGCLPAERGEGQRRERFLKGPCSLSYPNCLVFQSCLMAALPADMTPCT